jgi:hypothetical protein
MRSCLILYLTLTLCATAVLAETSGTRGMRVRSAIDAGIPQYDAEQCHALVVGINSYKHWSSLRSAANDAQSVADLLKSRFGYKNVTLLLNEQATRVNILQALDNYTRLSEQDSLLIYYAGHGWMDDYQNGFWVPHEAARDSKFDYVANSRIVNDYFKKYRVRHLLVIADSCFSGALMRGREHSRDSKWKLPAGFRKPSRWVLTSGDLAPVPDDAGGGHSPFATRLLQFLKFSDEPAFGIHDLYVYVRKNLKTEPLCEPINTAMHMPGGEYVFCRLDSPVTAASPQGPIGGPTVTIPPQPAVQHGALVVNSPVNGVVSIDGQGAYQITPTQNLRWGKIPTGTHNVAVVAGNQRWEARVQVVAGQTMTISADLESDQERRAREEQARQAELARQQAEEEALRKQQRYQLELERRAAQDLIRKQAAAERARRLRQLELERQANEKSTNKKVRRPKVH